MYYETTGINIICKSKFSIIANISFNIGIINNAVILFYPKYEHIRRNRRGYSYVTVYALYTPQKDYY